MESGHLNTISGHLQELRKTAIKLLLTLAAAFSSAFFFHQELFSILAQPLNGEKLLILSPGDGFCCSFKICFWAGILLSSPLLVFFLLDFILPALKRNEKEKVFPFLAVSFCCLFSGILLSFFIGIPFANKVLFEFNATLGNNVWTLPNYIDYTLCLLLAGGISFEMAGLLFLLVRYGVVSKTALRAKRKEAFLGAFILGAILTPPDVVTQGLMAGVLLVLYELAILLAKK